MTSDIQKLDIVALASLTVEPEYVLKRFVPSCRIARALDFNQSMTRQNKRYLVLDAMRGYAACIVVVWHFGLIQPGLDGPLAGTIAYMAVDFFLLLSGFILNHAYFRHDTFNLGTFAKARFARLYPLHLVTLLFIFVLATPLVEILFHLRYDHDLWLHILMIHNIGFGPSSLRFNGPAWSISVELWSNLLIAPLFVAAVRTKIAPSHRRAFLLGISLVGYAVLMMTVGQLDISYENIAPGVNSGMIRGLASFGLGILLYDAHRYLEATLSERARHILSKITPLCYVAFVLVFALPIGGTLFDFAFIPLFAAILLVASFELGPASKAITKAEFLGRISFSVYLIHTPIMLLYKATVGDVVYPFTYALILGATLGVSVLTHKYIELPSYTWGKKALDRVFAQMSRTLKQLT